MRRIWSTQLYTKQCLRARKVLGVFPIPDSEAARKNIYDNVYAYGLVLSEANKSILKGCERPAGLTRDATAGVDEFLEGNKEARLQPVVRALPCLPCRACRGHGACPGVPGEPVGSALAPAGCPP